MSALRHGPFERSLGCALALQRHDSSRCFVELFGTALCDLHDDICFFLSSTPRPPSSSLVSKYRDRRTATARHLRRRGRPFVQRARETQSSVHWTLSSLIKYDERRPRCRCRPWGPTRSGILLGLRRAPLLKGALVSGAQPCCRSGLSHTALPILPGVARKGRRGAGSPALGCGRVDGEVKKHAPRQQGDGAARKHPLAAGNPAIFETWRK